MPLQEVFKAPAPSQQELVLSQPDPSPLSRRKYPQFFKLKRRAHYFALQSMNDFLTGEIVQATVKDLATLTPAELRDSDRLWLKLIVEGHTILLSEVSSLCDQTFRGVYSLEGINHLTSLNSSPNLTFDSYDILEYTQAALSEKEQKDLWKITLDIIKWANPVKASSVIGKVLSKDLIFNSTDSLLNLLQSKKIDPRKKESLIDAWGAYLVKKLPPILEELESSKLLVFKTQEIDLADRAEMKQAILSHLDDYNESFSFDKEYQAFSSSTFTLRGLKAFLEAESWVIDARNLVKKLHIFNTADYWILHTLVFPLPPPLPHSPPFLFFLLSPPFFYIFFSPPFFYSLSSPSSTWQWICWEEGRESTTHSLLTL